MPFGAASIALWLVIRCRSSVVPFGAPSAAHGIGSTTPTQPLFGLTIGADPCRVGARGPPVTALAAIRPIADLARGMPPSPGAGSR